MSDHVVREAMPCHPYGAAAGRVGGCASRYVDSPTCKGHATDGARGRMSRYGNDQMCEDQNEQDITTRLEGRGNMSTCFAWYLDTTKGTRSFKLDINARVKTRNPY